jgi:hypothetical protein
MTSHITARTISPKNSPLLVIEFSGNAGDSIAYESEDAVAEADRAGALVFVEGSFAISRVGGPLRPDFPMPFLRTAGMVSFEVAEYPVASPGITVFTATGAGRNRYYCVASHRTRMPDRYALRAGAAVPAGARVFLAMGTMTAGARTIAAPAIATFANDTDVTLSSGSLALVHGR